MKVFLNIFNVKKIYYIFFQLVLVNNIVTYANDDKNYKMIGDPIEIEGFKITVSINKPTGFFSGYKFGGKEEEKDPSFYDLYFRLDIVATSDNMNGMQKGEFLSNSNVEYHFIKKDVKNQEIKGNLIQAIDKMGYHYGKNVKFPSSGEYILNFYISPPVDTKVVILDKEREVEPFFKYPIKIKMNFNYEKKI